MNKIEDYKNLKAWLIDGTIHQLRTNGKDYIAVHAPLDESDNTYGISQRGSNTMTDALLSILNYATQEDDIDLEEILGELPEDENDCDCVTHFYEEVDEDSADTERTKAD